MQSQEWPRQESSIRLPGLRRTGAAGMPEPSRALQYHSRKSNNEKSNFTSCVMMRRILEVVKKNEYYYILDWLINLMASYSITVKIIFIYFINNTWFIHLKWLCTEVSKHLGCLPMGSIRFFRTASSFSSMSIVSGVLRSPKLSFPAASSQSHSVTLCHIKAKKQ